MGIKRKFRNEASVYSYSAFAIAVLSEPWFVIYRILWMNSGRYLPRLLRICGTQHAGALPWSRLSCEKRSSSIPIDVRRGRWKGEAEAVFIFIPHPFGVFWAFSYFSPPVWNRTLDEKFSKQTNFLKIIYNCLPLSCESNSRWYKTISLGNQWIQQCSIDYKCLLEFRPWESSYTLINSYML
jgi:hypothetical protein